MNKKSIDLSLFRNNSQGSPGELALDEIAVALEKLGAVLAQAPQKSKQATLGLGGNRLSDAINIANKHNVEKSERSSTTLSAPWRYRLIFAY